jgi:hypothetical protein
MIGSYRSFSSHTSHCQEGKGKDIHKKFHLKASKITRANEEAVLREIHSKGQVSQLDIYEKIV